MCSEFGFVSGWWSVSGLIADFFGVALLGGDLIRVQRTLRANATAELNHFNAVAEEYGGVVSWSKEIQRNTRWVREHEFSGHHAEDEISYNARQVIDRVSELSGNVSALGEHLTEIIMLTQKKVEGDNVLAQTSLRWSYVGLLFILAGFCGQLIGSWPCA